MINHEDKHSVFFELVVRKVLGFMRRAIITDCFVWLFVVRSGSGDVLGKLDFAPTQKQAVIMVN